MAKDISEPAPERRLSAILAVDVAGYSRLIGADESGTLSAMRAHRRDVFDPAIARFGGRMVKTTGDGMLVEFASAVHAVECAVEAQRTIAARNRDVAQDRRIEFRIGVNVGDITRQGDDIFGDGVNIAARIEALAPPGGICISGRVHEDLQGKLELSCDDLGEQTLKNIARKVQVFAVRIDGGALDAGNANAPAMSLELPDKPSIAVLAFANMSGDPDQEYFADGIAEDIITALSKVRGFFVVARNSSFSFKGRAVDARKIASELGVQYLLEGSVRKAGERVRITAQLIDAIDDKHLWSEKFDRELTDIFAIQDEIARSVVSAAEPQLYQAESMRSGRMPTHDLRAWDYAIRALSSIWRVTGRDTAIAEKLLDVALAYDADYAFAHSLRGLVMVLRAHMGWEPNAARTLAAAREVSARAVALDAEDAWAHLALGYCHMLARETADAVAELEAATSLNPSFALAHMTLAMAHVFGGQPDQGRRIIEETMRISPRDPMTSYFSSIRGTAEFVAGNHTEGLAWSRKANRESPENPAALRGLVINYACLGALDEARAALAKVKQVQPGISLHYCEHVAPYADPDVRARYVEAFRLAGLE